VRPKLESFGLYGCIFVSQSVYTKAQMTVVMYCSWCSSRCKSLVSHPTKEAKI